MYRIEHCQSLSFSERNGIIPAKEIQLNSMDADLRNRLWNEIHSILSSPLQQSSVLIIWTDFFKEPRDLLLNTHSGRSQLHKIRVRYLAMSWNRVYDLTEFICKRGDGKLDITSHLIRKFIESCNSILEKEVSAYRIIDKNVVPITSQTELNEIEEALQPSMTNVANHLERALELLSDRNNPDYPNSIKESLSAVEAICRKIVQNDKLTLGQALNAMKSIEKPHFHPSMINAFSNMFGYASADSGIRHAAYDSGKDIPFTEAKFFLVVCSAFVNYLQTISADY